MLNKLFIYGTLSDIDVQKKVWGRVTLGVRDILIGYRKYDIEIDRVKYPIVVKDATEEVEGLVIDVSDLELEKIDEYETDVYKRTNVILKSGLTAWVYAKG